MLGYPFQRHLITEYRLAMGDHTQKGRKALLYIPMCPDIMYILKMLFGEIGKLHVMWTLEHPPLTGPLILKILQ